ncbi:MAG: DUF3352 domain-containing protein [Actinomycetota bacterium]|nr:DUF3352 domain-containing protein [Actinomycetota bacterium]
MWAASLALGQLPGRRAAALGSALILALAIAGCGSGSSGPADGAAKVTPADALAYVNLSLDSGRPAVAQALKLAKRLPNYGLAVAALQTRLGLLAGGSASGAFGSSVKPWLGNEAAIALLSAPTATPASLLMLDVRDRGQAQAFLSRAGARRASSYRGTPLLHTTTGGAAAFVSHFLVLGQDASVRDAVDVAGGHVPSLAASTTYQDAAAGQPDDRVLDAYASASGVRVLAGLRGFPGALGQLIYQPALSGVSIAVSPADNGARVRIHSALDSSLLRVSAPAGPSFKPSLAQAIPSGAVLMLEVAGLSRIAPRILSAGAAGGVAGQVGPLLGRLGKALASEGVNVSSLLSLFGGETAVTITSSSSKPALLIVARTAHEQQVRTQLAALEIPLEQLFPPAAAGPGQAPAFTDRQVAGVTIHQLGLAPGLELDYAVNNGLLLVSTGGTAIISAVRHPRSLADDPRFRAALPGVPEKATSLLFLDFSQLLSLGEQTGLTKSAQFRALRPDLQRIRAVGLTSTRGEADSTAELFLQIP